ncbi:helix-turn-helix transcriptional regulator [Polaromonas naphthalenivorans]|uniref:Transcriptional regulator, XRE family n=1 Tax=Polaromonas naphthalenivorans (strain CJ2) TaxID=365044 RepID=A1VW86_POLNA|nr:helix-turn-helix domain-containing protein [Polaromonas naphthalenivorans]ABM39914.1 transcriptional regulator, XRE family [Polaromonas naphthalenivorans CJ2]
MSAASNVDSVLDQQLLLQLGARLRHARVKRGLTTIQLAQQARISRMTLSAVEAGAPSPTMGSYLRVMGVLGVSQDLALVASDTLQGTAAQRTDRKVSSNTVVVPVSTGDARHELQDLQSLMLHEEAVRLLKKKPELIQQALDTLERWRSAGDPHSRFLWDEWSVILHRRAWRRALSLTRRSKELRQASPLATILPVEVRQRVLEQVGQAGQRAATR